MIRYSDFRQRVRADTIRGLLVRLLTQAKIRVGPGLIPVSHETAYSVGRHVSEL
ncbi:MAG: hypothetical protein M3R37_01795 [Actinomycetota bacterium]|nr:hypothetical protein [Actinomycetota bacterium]